MEELRELYQQVILDHNKFPKNFKALESPTHSSEGFNPLCGDKINLTLQVEEGKVEDIGFQGSGCAISKASASVMTSLVKGKTGEEIEALFNKFLKLIKSNISEPVNFDEVGKMAVFAGVREFPVRVKCAALAWHTLMAALEEDKKPITTE